MFGLFARKRLPENMASMPPAKEIEKPSIDAKDDFLAGFKKTAGEILPDDGVGLETERGENNFNFEVAVAEKEKAPGKGEDVTLTRSDQEKTFVAVADGVGSQPGGHDAAQIVVEEMSKLVFAERNFPKEKKAVESLVREAMFSAHDALKNSKLKELYPKMATTLASMVLYENKATIATSGDSLVYRFRDGKFEQLSPEDSVIGILKMHGIEVSTSILSEHLPDGSSRDLTLNDVLKKAKKIKLTRKYPDKYIDIIINNFGNSSLKKLRNKMMPRTAMSTEIESADDMAVAEKIGVPEWSPHVFTVDVEDGDEFLVTSDGLTDNCRDHNIEQGLNKLTGKSAREKAAALQAHAEKMQNLKNNPDANKPDDISIIYIKAESKKGTFEEEEFEEIGAEELEQVG